MAIRIPTNHEILVSQETHNPFFNNFKQFRKAETEKRAESQKYKIGQSLDAISETSYNGGKTYYGGMSQYENAPPEEKLHHIGDEAAMNWVEINRTRYMEYHRMSNRAEIRYILFSICNEAIVGNEEEEITYLHINDNLPDVSIGEITKRQLQREFEYVMKKFLNMEEEGHKYFEDFLIEGAQFWEVTYAKDSDRIVGLNRLPSYNMLTLTENGEIIGYRQIIETESYTNSYQLGTTYTTGYAPSNQYIDYHPNQILFWDYNKHGFGGINDRYSYLEPAKKLCNQIGLLEDCILRYRILRGHETRAFFIATGNMPTTQAQAWVNKQAQQFTRKIYYNPSDGTVTGMEKVQSMLEDFYFPNPANGNTSRIESIPAGVNLDKLDDLNWFRQQLCLSLFFPISRSQMLSGGESAASSYSNGKPGEVSRDEINFSRFIEMLQRTFSKQVAIPLFIMYLETSDRYSDDIKNEDIFTCKFTESNLFKLFKENEVTNLKLDVLQKVASYIDDGTDGPNSLFAPQYIMKYMLNMNDFEISKNKEMVLLNRLEKIRRAEKIAQQNSEADGGMGSLGVPGDITGMGGGSPEMGLIAPDLAANGVGGAP